MIDTLFDVDELHAGGGAPPPEDRGDPELTAEQARAVAERGRSLAVSANAGSGKTSVLVERFVQAVLQDGVDPARVLAITFTDKAAGELRERVRRRFLELGERDHARATEAAFVSTIHGFCTRVLRAHPLAAGLDPRFSVLDEARASRLRDQAFASALRAFLGPAAERREALDLAAAYGADRLRSAIVGVHEALRSQGHARPRLPHVEPRPAPVAERAALEAAHARLAAELAHAGEGKKVDEARERLEACARLLEELEAHVVPWPGRLGALKVVCGNATALQSDACEAYVAARDAFERACADHHAARAVPLLDELLGHFADAYAAAKRERGALDFDDLELGARALFAGHPAIARAWSERFALVMIDEFQDTNRRQMALLEALEGGNLATVGDEFQSIYGFRHADVEIFRERRGALEADGGAIVLADNFRARPEILTAVNAIFAERFGEEFVPLRGARPRAGATRTELLLTDQRGWDEVDLGATLPAAVPAWRRAEARLVAQRIRELVDAGEARAGEVAILVRATASMPVLERALADVGLPALATAGRGFWTRQEVVDLVGWLSAVANPLDERALVGALASPLGGVSADALAVATAAARGGGSRPARDLWWALEGALLAGEEAAWTADLTEADRAALTAFCARLAGERRAAARRSPDELLGRVVEATGYDLYLLGLLGGARRLANVDKLRRLARDLAAAEGPSLRAFLDHAAALEQAQRREPEAPVDDPEADAVRLMTIHAAKGLEFDVVVVADLGRAPFTGSPTLLVDGERVGLRLEMLDGTRADALDFTELNDRRRAAEAAEEDRVAYVALTRARERLIVSGALDPDRRANGAATAPIVWVAPALVPDAVERLAAEEPEPLAEVAVEFAGETATVRVVVNAPATLGEALRDPAPEAAGEVAGAPSAPVPAPPSGAPAAASAEGPGTLSYTALAFYERCPLRFRAQRVLGLPDVPPPGAPPKPPGLEPRDRGVLVHALLEELDLAAGGPPRPERVAALARELGLEAGRADLERAAELAGAFAAAPVARRLAGARHEVEFAFELSPAGGAALLTGAVDVLAVEPDGAWLVVDAKTDRVAADADLEALTEGEYGIQRRLYALAALRAGAPRVEVVHVYLERPDEPASAVYGPADAAALATRLAAPAEGIARGEFAPTDRPHAALCATCPARERLCPHPMELKLRPSADPPVSPPR